MKGWQVLRNRAARLSRSWWVVFVCGMAAVVAAGYAQRMEKGAEPPPVRSAEKPGSADATPSRPDHAGNGASEAREPDGQAWGPLARVTVRVWLEEEGRVETVPLELYVRGVLAGEMPIDFHEEALKAQAIAARTYIVKRLHDGAGVDPPAAHGKADVDDTVATQVYIPLKRLLVDRTNEQLSRLNRAVMSTAAEIVTYGGEPIQAAFFSTSNGYTENSEDYWSLRLPYLRSVPSPWDAGLSPRYKETVTMKLADFYTKLGVSGKGRPVIRAEAWTTGKRIKTLRVGSRTFSGREVRERLGLRSSQFDWSIDGGMIRLTTYGSGHGVGMSQWGADGLAGEGKTAIEILEYYYTGAKVERIEPDRL